MNMKLLQEGTLSLHTCSLIHPLTPGIQSSVIYQTRQRSFLFDVTKLGIIDGIRLGNKVRYMNTASTNGKSSMKNNCRGESMHGYDR